LTVFLFFEAPCGWAVKVLVNFRLQALVWVSVPLPIPIVKDPRHLDTKTGVSSVYLFVSPLTISLVVTIQIKIDLDLIFGVLTPLSAIFQVYHGDQF